MTVLPSVVEPRAAVHLEPLPGDETARVGGEKQADAADLRDVGHAAEFRWPRTAVIELTLTIVPRVRSRCGSAW